MVFDFVFFITLFSSRVLEYYRSDLLYTLMSASGCDSLINAREGV